MNEHAAWSTVPSLAPVIQSLAWDDTSYLYLEQVPQTWLSEKERQQGVQLRRYDPDIAWDTWPKGFVFNADHELKWEQRQGHVHVVYCGVQPPAGWTLVPLQAVRQQDQTYYLWGRRVQEQDRAGLGGDPQTPLFVETQIPRLLSYPLAPRQGRLRVRIRELYSADGQLCYARWCGLQEEAV